MDKEKLYSRGYEDGICYLPFEDQEEREQFVNSLTEEERAEYYRGFNNGYSFVERMTEEVSS